MIQTGARGKKRAKSVGRQKVDGYNTDFAQRQKMQQDEEAIDYDNLNEQFGDVSVSGKFVCPQQGEGH